VHSGKKPRLLPEQQSQTLRFTLFSVFPRRTTVSPIIAVARGALSGLLVAPGRVCAAAFAHGNKPYNP